MEKEVDRPFEFLRFLVEQNQCPMRWLLRLCSQAANTSSSFLQS
jgi:hypothetical protein